MCGLDTQGTQGHGKGACGERMPGDLLVQYSVYGLSCYGGEYGGISAGLSASDGLVYDGGAAALPGSGRDQRICVCEAVLRGLYQASFVGCYAGKQRDQFLLPSLDQCGDDGGLMEIWEIRGEGGDFFAAEIGCLRFWYTSVLTEYNTVSTLAVKCRNLSGKISCGILN